MAAVAVAAVVVAAGVVAVAEKVAVGVVSGSRSSRSCIDSGIGGGSSSGGITVMAIQVSAGRVDKVGRRSRNAANDDGFTAYEF